MRCYRLDGRVAVPCAPDAATWHDRRVALWGRGEIAVSTVFLVYDHGWPDCPLLFETMVFGGALDGTQERYSTWDEAEAGHAAMVARVEAALGMGRE